MSRLSLLSARGARRAAVLAVLAALCPLVLATPAGAQVRPGPAPAPAGPTPRAGSWEVGGGVTYAGGFDLGDSDANLTRNTPDGNPFTLFATSADVGSVPGFEGRLAYYLTPRFAVEGGVSFSQPVVTYEITGDAENAPDVNAEETLDRYLFTGSALWHFTRPSARARAVPFIFGGAGYLRELHEGQELVETGTEYHAGGGVKVWFGGARRRLGLRGDAGVSLRDGGVDAEDGFRAVPIAAASLIFLF